MKKALLFGASGFIGSHLLKDLLSNSDYEQVTIVVRKAPQLTHPKLKVLIGDLNSLPLLKNDLIADEVYIAIGTTKKKTPDQSEYYKIDHDYPVLAAKLAKENGAQSVFLVSSVGATVKSKTFYLKTKGETERDIESLGYQQTRVFRPSMLLGSREEHRPIEKIANVIFPLLNPLLLGNLKSFKGIDGKDVALAMVKSSQQKTSKVKVYEWNEMHQLIGA